MADKNKDPLVYCPRDCGHMVKQSRKGDPHTATETVDGQIETYTCKD